MKNSLFLNTRVIFENGGAEKAKESVKSETSAAKPEGAPGDVDDTKGQVDNLIGNAMDNTMELADKDPEQLYQQCLEADKLFLKAVDRSLYSGKEEKAETNLIAAGEKVAVVKPGVDKYKSAYKAPNKPNVPTPNVLVEYMANAVYKNIDSSFTDPNGSTNEKRGDKLYDYIFKGDEKQWSARAQQVAKWFSDAKTAIEKGMA